MRLFDAGQIYEIMDPDGCLREWHCIHANEQFAWLCSRPYDGNVAYCWSQDGNSVSLGPGYRALNQIADLAAKATALGYRLVKAGDAL